MKHLYLIIALLSTISFNVSGQQQGAMTFAGPSTLSVDGFGQVSSSESDTILFSMNPQSLTADITLPALTYLMAGSPRVIPSFTIHNASFTMDMATMNATFADQPFAETTIDASGVEKNITGASLSATYTHAERSFNLLATYAYGGMPLNITYAITAIYVTPTSVQVIEETNSNNKVYDLLGNKWNGGKGIVIINGRKVIIK